MATTHFIANLIDAETNTVLRAKRATASKAYTHMVFVRKPASLVAKYARQGLQMVQENIVEYRALIAQGEVKPSYSNQTYVESLAESEKWQSTYETMLAAAEAGTPGPWLDGGWASRRDLAEKNAVKWEKRGYNAVIVEAVVVDAPTHRAVSAVANA